jgi:hypothetical protein
MLWKSSRAYEPPANGIKAVYVPPPGAVVLYNGGEDIPTGSKTKTKRTMLLFVMIVIVS